MPWMLESWYLTNLRLRSRLVAWFICIEQKSRMYPLHKLGGLFAYFCKVSGLSSCLPFSIGVALIENKFYCFLTHILSQSELWARWKVWLIHRSSSGYVGDRLTSSNFRTCDQTSSPCCVERIEGQWPGKGGISGLTGLPRLIAHVILLLVRSKIEAIFVWLREYRFPTLFFE